MGKTVILGLTQGMQAQMITFLLIHRPIPHSLRRMGAGTLAALLRQCKPKATLHLGLMLLDPLQ
jgi:hypothetical protein